MDLGTVKTKLLNSKYNFIEECIEEIQLIWDNCKKYNAPSSVFLISLIIIVDSQVSR